MTTTTYSALPVASALSGPEIISLDQGGVTSQSTINAISTFIGPLQSQVLTDAVNLNISITTASNIATITADQVTLGTALNGTSIVLPSFNQNNTMTINGAGGLDTGTATYPGFVSVYAIYNPTSQTTSSLSTVTTSLSATEIYSGANMPSGYTYSRLLTTWMLHSNNFYEAGFQHGKRLWIQEAVYGFALGPIAWTSVSIAASVPINAKKFVGRVATVYTGGFPAPLLGLSPSGSTLGQQITSTGQAAGATIATNQIIDLPLITAQTVYYEILNNSITGSSGFTVCGYTI